MKRAILGAPPNQPARRQTSKPRLHRPDHTAGGLITAPGLFLVRQSLARQHSSRAQTRVPSDVKYSGINADCFGADGGSSIELAVAMQDDATFDVGSGKVR